jgi:uncharacterized protein YkwD
LNRIRVLAAAVLTAAAITAASAAPAQAGPRKQMIRTINYVRSWNHRHPLHLSNRLSRSAAAWARHLMRCSVLSHAAVPSGQGEILEWHTGGGAAVNSTVMEWWHSSGHRRVMLAGDFSRAGAGRATGYFGGRKSTIWVVRFS